MINNNENNFLFDNEYKKFEKALRIFYVKYVKITEEKVCDLNSKTSVTLFANSSGKYVGKKIELNDNN